MNVSPIRLSDKRWLLFGLYIFLISSCTHYYGPSEFMIMGVENAGQFKAAAGLESINATAVPNLRAQTTYSPVQHLQLQAGISRNIFNPGETYNNASLGIGYYWQSKREQLTSVGIAVSSSSTKADLDQYKLGLEARQLVLQSNGRIKNNENYQVTVGLGIGILDFTSMNIDGYVGQEDWEEIMDLQALDPNLFVRSAISSDFELSPKLLLNVSLGLSMSPSFNQPSGLIQSSLVYSPRGKK